MKSNFLSLMIAAGLIFGGCASKDEIRIGKAANAVDIAYETPAALIDKHGLFTPEALSLQDGYDVQALRVRYMREDRDFAGYKIAAAGPGLQKALNLDAPVTGVFMKDMLLADGSSISLASGAGLAYEADLIVRVASERINNAKTVEDIAAALDEGYVFIEVPDLGFMQNQPPHGGLIAAFNAGARFGVMGDKFAISADPDFISALGEMTVLMLDENGAELARTNGKAGSGENPLRAILFLTAQLNARGERLSVGDYISPGGFTAPVRAIPGQTITVRYDGLNDEVLSASVAFTK